ncbi:histidine phosphotransferase family protein [Roseovarius aestuarii]|nr:histidine phosphotransferase family protein [Roseovarius aestuarii]
MQSNRNLGALIGSRICHDMISPVGAIANGLELLTLTGVPSGPEMDLITGSAAQANARIKYFRLAFGLACDAQFMSAGEITGILSDIYKGAIDLEWHVDTPLARPIAQATVLGLMCAEQAVPHGGTLHVSGTPASLKIQATGTRLNPNADHWALLDAALHTPPDIPAAQVQFALLPEILRDLGRPPQVALNADAVTLRF